MDSKETEMMAQKQESQINQVYSEQTDGKMGLEQADSDRHDLFQQTPFKTQSNFRTYEDGQDESEMRLRDTAQFETTEVSKQEMVAIKDIIQCALQMQRQSLQLFKTGYNRQSLDVVKQIVKMRISIESGSSEALIDYLAQVARLFNQASIELLNLDEPDESLQVLQSLHQILLLVDQGNSKVSSAVSLTLSNMSSVFKRKGEIQEARECLTNTLKMVRQPDSVSCDPEDRQKADEAAEDHQKENNALFHLNICAQLSQLDNHEKAKTHASIAVKDLESAVLKLKSQIEEADSGKIKLSFSDRNKLQKQPSASSLHLQDLKSQFKDRVSLLAIAYFNLGCEAEHLSQIDECLEAYQRAQGLEMGRYGHYELEMQFAKAVRQVRARLRDQTFHKRSRSNTRGSKQPSRQNTRSPGGKRSQMGFKTLFNPSQSASFGNNIEKTMIVMQKLKRANSASSQGRSQVASQSAQAISENNQPKWGTQTRLSSTKSEGGLQEIKEERLVQTPVKSFTRLPLENQKITPSKEMQTKMARTGNSFAPGGKPIEPDQQIRRVFTSEANSRKRPQSATNTQRNLFDSTYSNQRGPPQQEKPIQIRLNKKVFKCLNSNKWTKNWYENNAFFESSHQMQKIQINDPAVAESLLPSSLAAESDVHRGTTFSQARFSSALNSNNVTIAKDPQINMFNGNQQPSKTLINTRPPQAQPGRRIPRGGRQLATSLAANNPVTVFSRSVSQQAINAASLTNQQNPSSLFPAYQVDKPSKPLKKGGSPKQKRASPKRKKKTRRNSPQQVVAPVFTLFDSPSEPILLPRISTDMLAKTQANWNIEPMTSHSRIGYRAVSASKRQQEEVAILPRATSHFLQNNKSSKQQLSKSPHKKSLSQKKQRQLEKQFIAAHMNAININFMSSSGGASRGTGQGRQRQLSQAKMLKKMSKSTSGSLNRQEVIDKFAKLNKNLVYLGQIEAAERYTRGPITQVIKPLDDSNNLVITQTINPKTKKPEILRKQIVPIKNPKKSIVQIVNNQMAYAARPPTVSQPFINYSSQQKLEHLIAPEVDQSGKESTFVKNVENKVLRQTKLIEKQDKALQENSERTMSVKKHNGSIEEEIPSAEEDVALTETERGGGMSSKMSKAAIIMQSCYRGFKVRQQLNQEKQASSKGLLPSSTRTLELDGEYDNDDFHSSEGKQELSHVKAAGSDIDSIHSESKMGQTTVKEDSIIDEEIEGQKQASQRNFESPERSVENVQQEEPALDTIDLKEMLQMSYMDAIEQYERQTLEESQSKEILHTSYMDAIEQLEKEALELRRNHVDQKDTKTVDEQTQTSLLLESKPKLVEVVSEPTIQLAQIATQTDDPIKEESSEQSSARQASSVGRENKDVEVRLEEIPFLPIAEDELELVQAQYDDGPEPAKVQIVSLPFDRDQGGVKLGFKAIRRSNPTFQNELIHIDLELAPEQLGDHSISESLLKVLEMEEKTGNLSIPQTHKNKAALFTMLVESQEQAAETQEVIAVYENDSEILAAAGLDSGVVVIQPMKNASNKVTIPIKKNSRRQPTLDDLKSNLQKHLPKIVYIDSDGHVTLATGEKPRIGRVLPAGQGSQNLSLDSSHHFQLASDHSATFISQLDREKHYDDRMSGFSAAKSQSTRLAAQRSGDFGYDGSEIQIDQQSLRDQSFASACPEELETNTSQTVYRSSERVSRIVELTQSEQIRQNKISPLPAKEVKREELADQVLQTDITAEISRNDNLDKESRESSIKVPVLKSQTKSVKPPRPASSNSTAIISRQEQDLNNDSQDGLSSIIVPNKSGHSNRQQMRADVQLDKITEHQPCPADGAIQEYQDQISISSIKNDSRWNQKEILNMQSHEPPVIKLSFQFLDRQETDPELLTQRSRRASKCYKNDTSTIQPQKNHGFKIPTATLNSVNSHRTRAVGYAPETPRNKINIECDEQKLSSERGNNLLKCPLPTVTHDIHTCYQNTSPDKSGSGDSLREVLVAPLSQDESLMSCSINRDQKSFSSEEQLSATRNISIVHHSFAGQSISEASLPQLPPKPKAEPKKKRIDDQLLQKTQSAENVASLESESDQSSIKVDLNKIALNAVRQKRREAKGEAITARIQNSNGLGEESDVSSICQLSAKSSSAIATHVARSARTSKTQNARNLVTSFDRYESHNSSIQVPQDQAEDEVETKKRQHISEVKTLAALQDGELAMSKNDVKSVSAACIEVPLPQYNQSSSSNFDRAFDQGSLERRSRISMPALPQKSMSCNQLGSPSFPRSQRSNQLATAAAPRTVTDFEEIETFKGKESVNGIRLESHQSPLQVFEQSVKQSEPVPLQRIETQTVIGRKRQCHTKNRSEITHESHESPIQIQNQAMSESDQEPAPVSMRSIDTQTVIGKQRNNLNKSSDCITHESYQSPHQAEDPARDESIRQPEPVVPMRRIETQIVFGRKHSLIKLANDVSSLKEEAIPQISHLSSHKDQSIVVEVMAETPRMETSPQIRQDSKVSSLKFASKGPSQLQLPQERDQPEIDTSRGAPEKSPFQQKLDDSSLKNLSRHTQHSQMEKPQKQVEKEVLTSRQLAVQADIRSSSDVSSLHQGLVQVAPLPVLPTPQDKDHKDAATERAVDQQNAIVKGSDSGISNLPQINVAKNAKSEKKMETEESSRTEQDILQESPLKLSERKKQASESNSHPLLNALRLDAQSKVPALPINLADDQEGNLRNAKSPSLNSGPPLKDEPLRDTESEAPEIGALSPATHEPLPNAERIEEGSISAQSSFRKLIKIKPSQIKTLKTKKPTRWSGKSIPSTKRVQNSSRVPEEVTSDLSEGLFRKAETLTQQENCQSDSSLIEKSTARNVVIERCIRHLYTRENLAPSISQPKDSKGKSKSRSSGTVNRSKGIPVVSFAANPTNQTNQTGIYPEEAGSSTMMFQGKFWNNTDKNLDEQKELSEEEKAQQQMTHQASVTLSQTMVNDWRAGVQIKFSVTGPNSSAIQLVESGVLVDTKNIAFNIEKIARNYDVANVDAFCNQWLMPCISIKTAEWQSIGQELEATKPTLQLQVHGEMLSELIFKQFVIHDSRPASAITQTRLNDADVAREYSDDQIDLTSNERSQIMQSNNNKGTPLHQIDETQVDPSVSDNAKTAPAAVQPEIAKFRVPLEKYPTTTDKETGKGKISQPPSDMSNYKSVPIDQNRPTISDMQQESESRSQNIL